MRLQPRLLLGRGVALPGVAGFGWMGGQVTPQGIHPHPPEVLTAGETAPPTRSGPAVEVPIWDRGAVADRAQSRYSGPGLRPGGLVTPWRTLAAAGQIVLNERNGGTGALGGAAAVAGAITTDMVGGAVQTHDVVGLVDGDLRRWGGKCHAFAKGAAKLGDDVGDHGSASS